MVIGRSTRSNPGGRAGVLARSTVGGWKVLRAKTSRSVTTAQTFSMLILGCFPACFANAEAKFYATLLMFVDV